MGRRVYVVGNFNFHGNTTQNLYTLFSLWESAKSARLICHWKKLSCSTEVITRVPNGAITALCLVTLS